MEISLKEVEKASKKGNADRLIFKTSLYNFINNTPVSEPAVLKY